MPPPQRICADSDWGPLSASGLSQGAPRDGLSDRCRHVVHHATPEQAACARTRGDQASPGSLLPPRLHRKLNSSSDANAAAAAPAEPVWLPRDSPGIARLLIVALSSAASTVGSALAARPSHRRPGFPRASSRKSQLSPSLARGAPHCQVPWTMARCRVDKPQRVGKPASSPAHCSHVPRARHRRRFSHSVHEALNPRQLASLHRTASPKLLPDGRLQSCIVSGLLPGSGCSTCTLCRQAAVYVYCMAAHAANTRALSAAIRRKTTFHPFYCRRSTSDDGCDAKRQPLPWNIRVHLAGRLPVLTDCYRPPPAASRQPHGLGLPHEPSHARFAV